MLYDWLSPVHPRQILYDGAVLKHDYLPTDCLFTVQSGGKVFQGQADNLTYMVPLRED